MLDRWLKRLFFNRALPLTPLELSPEDKYNLALLVDDDMYRAYRKLMRNYTYLIHTQALAHTTPLEAENFRGQLRALRNIERTLLKIHKEVKRKKTNRV